MHPSEQQPNPETSDKVTSSINQAPQSEMLPNIGFITLKMTPQQIMEYIDDLLEHMRLLNEDDPYI